MLVYYVIGLLFILAMLLIWLKMVRQSQASHEVIIYHQKEIIHRLLVECDRARDALLRAMRDELEHRQAARIPVQTPAAQGRVTESGFGQL